MSESAPKTRLYEQPCYDCDLFATCRGDFDDLAARTALANQWTTKLESDPSILDDIPLFKASVDSLMAQSSDARAMDDMGESKLRQHATQLEATVEAGPPKPPQPVVGSGAMRARRTNNLIEKYVATRDIIDTCRLIGRCCLRDTDKPTS